MLHIHWFVHPNCYFYLQILILRPFRNICFVPFRNLNKNVDFHFHKNSEGRPWTRPELVLWPPCPGPYRRGTTSRGSQRTAWPSPPGGDGWWKSLPGCPSMVYWPPLGQWRVCHNYQPPSCSRWSCPLEHSSGYAPLTPPPGKNNKLLLILYRLHLFSFISYQTRSSHVMRCALMRIAVAWSSFELVQIMQFSGSEFTPLFSVTNLNLEGENNIRLRELGGVALLRIFASGKRTLRPI